MTDVTREHSVIAVYETHAAAEAAIKALQSAGLDMTRMSIIGKDVHTEEHATGFYNIGDRMRFWGANGAFWGSLWGMLVGTAFIMVPTVGPLIVMGPLAGWIIGAIEGAALGATGGVLAAALASIGIPQDSIVKYEVEVKTGKFLVLARGSADMIEHARGVLAASGASDVSAHVG